MEIKTLDDVVAVRQKVVNGVEVSPETIRACVEFLRESRKTAMTKASAKKEAAKAKPTLTLDDLL